MLRFGCLILTVWTVLNAIPSAVILFVTLTERGYTPALYSLLTQTEIDSFSSETLATIDSMAVFANGLNLALCLLVIAIIWMGLYRNVRWCFWAVAMSLIFAVLAGFAADYVVGNLHPTINIASLLIVVAGLACVSIPNQKHPSPSSDG